MSQRLPGDQRAAPPAQVRAGRGEARRGGAGSGFPAAQGHGTGAGPRRREEGSGQPLPASGAARGGRGGSVRIPHLVRMRGGKPRVFTQRKHSVFLPCHPVPAFFWAALERTRKAGALRLGTSRVSSPRNHRWKDYCA